MLPQTLGFLAKSKRFLAAFVVVVALGAIDSEAKAQLNCQDTYNQVQYALSLGQQLENMVAPNHPNFEGFNLRARNLNNHLRELVEISRRGDPYCWRDAREVMRNVNRRINGLTRQVYSIMFGGPQSITRTFEALIQAIDPLYGILHASRGTVMLRNRYVMRRSIPTGDVGMRAHVPGWYPTEELNAAQLSADYARWPQYRQ